MDGIFDGLRVLDFSQVLAGPTATRLMAELGAEVIKVEMAPSGDIGRGLPQIRDGRSGYYVQQNRGKRSVCVDLKDPRGRELVMDLIPDVDVMVQNFGFGVIDRLGFGYEVVSAINPRLIVCNMSAFGRTGPLRDHPGYDPIAQAYAGILHMIGEAGAPPALAGISPGDVLTGVHSFGGVAAALYHRERTGQGQEVSVSLLDAYTSAHEINLQALSIADDSEPTRSGSVHPIIGGIGVFAVGGGGSVVLAAINDRQWQATCEAMGRAELGSDPRFDSGPQRCENRDEVNRLVNEWLSSESDRDDVVRRLEALRVPVAPVLSVAEASVHPHLLESGAIRWVEDDVLGQVLVPGMPIKFSSSPGSPALAARQLGQDNEFVATELAGRSGEDYRALVEAGVLVHDPDS